MAIRELGQKQSVASAEMIDAIASELARDDTQLAPEGAPVIYREQSGMPENYTHWYVVWDQFAHVDNEERSRLILAAVREFCGELEALKVTIAMGLTLDEAEELGFDE
jgi:hypothetical protein